MAMLEARPYRPFKSSEEYLEAMKEDLAEWLSTLYPDLMINAENFMDRLDTGVALCKHANYVRQAAEDYLVRRQARNKSMTRSMTSGLAGPILAMGNVHYLLGAKSGTFFARDNVSNFIAWCRKGLKIIECLLFETDDLIMRKNEKHVILCLLEVARRGAKFGMLAPMLVQMERQIDREIAADNKAKGIGCGTQTDTTQADGTQTDTAIGTESVATETELFDTDSDNEDEDDAGPMLVYGPQPQIITNDLKSLDEMVRDLVEKCTCPSQFPMVRVSEGKYRIGDTKVLIFVRILRSHVMVRVGGGWDTLSHYLDKHDPCRCKAQHRTSVAARLIPRTNNQSNGIELHKAQVIFERSPPTARKLITNFSNTNTTTETPSATASASAVSTISTKSNLSPSYGSGNKNRSRSPTPQRKYLNHLNNMSMNDTNAAPTIANEKQQQQQQQQQLTTAPTTTGLLTSPGLARRSMSPSPRRLIDIRKKQTSLDSYNSGPKSLPLGGTDTSNNHVQFDSLNLIQTEAINQTIHANGAADATTTTSSTSSNNSNKFDNISDNGSEISDEGYRSLGVIQSNAQKRESIHSQASIEDAESNARLDQTSSDSQLSPVDDPVTSTKTPEIPDTDYASLPSESQIDAGPQSLPAVLHENLYSNNKFEQSGIFITDDEITVDIGSTTKKTIEADVVADVDLDIVATDATKKTKIAATKASSSKKNTKIPCSPRAERRRSIDNSTCGTASGSLQDISPRTGQLMFNRKKPVYRSVRKPTASELPQQSEAKTATTTRKSNIPGVRDVTNTWSGRTLVNGGKKRQTISAETFTPTTNASNASNATATATATTTPSTAATSGSAFERNIKSRSSQILYDSNGRRVRGCTASLNTSPVKSHAGSPLAQQLLEAASSAKNDAQILEKMKALLSRYASKNQSPTATKQQQQQQQQNKNKTPVYEDFTSAWVHSNGNLERSSSCSPPTKMRSKRSSAASSCESNNSRDMSVITSPRRARGLSKIPAPVQRQHTELY